MSRPRRKPIRIGKRIGRLKVHKDTGEQDKFGNRIWLCLCDCGLEKRVSQVHLDRGGTRSCGCLQKELARKLMKQLRVDTGQGRREKAKNWRGGRSINKNGYVEIWCDDYPGDTKPRNTLEHRYVMAKHLGRPLLRDEQVHHKNGDRQDNHLENLELWTTSHPYGQRVADKIEWAKQMLRRYEPSALAI